MKFKVNASDLNEALDIVSIVPPRPITPQGGTGYLFIVRDGTCHVYSRDTLQVSRASFPIFDVEGDGSFIYPADKIAGFRFLQDEVLSFEASSEGDTHIVKYTSPSGANSERTTHDPRLMVACDKDVEGATNARSFPVSILREAISMSKQFLPEAKDPKVEDHYKAIQLFDDSNEAWSRGDGSLFSADGSQAFYFYCDAFKGKPFSLHVQHLPNVLSFFSKCEGEVTIKTGQNMTFAVDSKDRVIGWTHHTKTHQKYSYYALKNDRLIFDVPVRTLVNALKYMGVELDGSRDKIRIHFSTAKSEVSFTAVDAKAKVASFFVPVVPKEGSEERDFTFSINLNHLLGLFSSAKGDRIELRITVMPADERRPKDMAMIRTLDEFLLNSDGKVVGGSGVEKQPENTYQCRVTRFMPSMD